MTGKDDTGNDDQEFDRMLRNYRTLTLEQRDLLHRRVIGRARAHRAQAFRDLFRSIIAWFRRRKAIAQLQRFDDRMLKDIGVRRGEIEAAVDGRLRQGVRFGPRLEPAVPATGVRRSPARASASIPGDGAGRAA